MHLDHGRPRTLRCAARTQQESRDRPTIERSPRDELVFRKSVGREPCHLRRHDELGGAAGRRDVHGGRRIETRPRHRDRTVRRDREAVADEIGREIAGRKAGDRSVLPTRDEPDLGASVHVERVGDLPVGDLELVDDLSVGRDQIAK